MRFQGLELFSAFSILIACSGSGGGGGANGSGAATSDSVRDYCTANCTESCMCGNPLPSSCPSRTDADTQCVSRCVAEEATSASRTRDAWFVNRAACIRSFFGDAGADSCSYSRGSQCSKRQLADPSFPNIAVVQKCHSVAAKAGACTTEGAYASVDDYCDDLAALTDSARQDTDTTCLGGDKTCDVLRKCIVDELGY